MATKYPKQIDGVNVIITNGFPDYEKGITIEKFYGYDNNFDPRKPRYKFLKEETRNLTEDEIEEGKKLLDKREEDKEKRKKALEISAENKKRILSNTHIGLTECYKNEALSLLKKILEEGLMCEEGYCSPSCKQMENSILDIFELAGIKTTIMRHY